MKAEDRGTAQEMISLLLQCSKISTVRSIYERIKPGPTGKIRTAQSPAGTETGRMNHRETFLERSTNLGNLPKKIAGLDPLYDARGVLRAEDGRIFVEADLNQAEARVAAWASKDRRAISEYENGVDRYRLFASALYGIPQDDVTKPQRHIGKTAILALQYGVSWKTLMEHVNEDADLTGATVNAATAKRAVALFHNLYPSYAHWWSEVWREIERTGTLTNAFGRRRMFFGRQDSEAGRAAVRREAVAFVPQSTIADLLNSGLAEVYLTYDPRVLRVLLQIHDAILVDTEERMVKLAAQVLKKTLEREIEIGGQKLVIPVEISVGKVWGKMEKFRAG